MAFVAISIMNFVLETHPICKIDKETGKSMSVLEPEDLTPTGSIMVGQHTSPTMRIIVIIMF